jgi:hypothetical protein
MLVGDGLPLAITPPLWAQALMLRNDLRARLEYQEVMSMISPGV